MKKILSTWVTKLKSETPAFWKWVRNFSGGVIAAVGIINTTAASASAPIWFTNYQWYILAGAGVIGFIAQSQTKTEKPV